MSLHPLYNPLYNLASFSHCSVVFRAVAACLKVTLFSLFVSLPALRGNFYLASQKVILFSCGWSLLLATCCATTATLAAVHNLGSWLTVALSAYAAVLYAITSAAYVWILIYPIASQERFFSWKEECSVRAANRQQAFEEHKRSAQRLLEKVRHGLDREEDELLTRMLEQRWRGKSDDGVGDAEEQQSMSGKLRSCLQREICPLDYAELEGSDNFLFPSTGSSTCQHECHYESCTVHHYLSI